MIYFDNAATGIHKPDRVIQAVCQAMQQLGNAGRGAHRTALDTSRLIYGTRCKLASFVACPRPEHVIFTANATEALNIALRGLFQPGDHVIASDREHNSALRPLYYLQEHEGLQLDFVPADADGAVQYADYEALIRPETRAIVCTHASNVTGDMIDLTRLGQLCRDKGLLLIVDAAQTAGIKRINMQEMGIHVLCLTGHKGLQAPQGTGALCLDETVEIRPFKCGGSGVQSYLKTQPEAYPTRLEAGTLNSHGIAGLNAALDYLNETGIDKIDAREQTFMRHFYNGLRQIPEVQIYGDFDVPDRAAIVALNIAGLDSSSVSDILATDYDIATRAGAHCAPRLHQALGTVRRGIVRFSFSEYNTEKEVNAALKAIREIARHCR